jgi:hypothetical protein
MAPARYVAVAILRFNSNKGYHHDKKKMTLFIQSISKPFKPRLPALSTRCSLPTRACTMQSNLSHVSDVWTCPGAWIGSRGWAIQKRTTLFIRSPKLIHRWYHDLWQVRREILSGKQHHLGTNTNTPFLSCFLILQSFIPEVKPFCCRLFVS